jgi:hypothetical protein
MTSLWFASYRACFYSKPSPWGPCATYSIVQCLKIVLLTAVRLKAFLCVIIFNVIPSYLLLRRYYNTFCFTVVIQGSAFCNIQRAHSPCKAKHTRFLFFYSRFFQQETQLLTFLIANVQYSTPKFENVIISRFLFMREAMSQGGHSYCRKWILVLLPRNSWTFCGISRNFVSVNTRFREYFLLRKFIIILPVNRQIHRQKRNLLWAFISALQF